MHSEPIGIFAVCVSVGVAVGVIVGVAVGVIVGVTVGVLVGVLVGVIVGVWVGVSVGSGKQPQSIAGPRAVAPAEAVNSSQTYPIGQLPSLHIGTLLPCTTPEAPKSQEATSAPALVAATNTRAKTMVNRAQPADNAPSFGSSSWTRTSLYYSPRLFARAHGVDVPPSGSRPRKRLQQGARYRRGLATDVVVCIVRPVAATNRLLAMARSATVAILLTPAFAATTDAAPIPATPLMTVYQFDGPLQVPYYDVDRFLSNGPSAPAGTVAQGTSVIPCLVIRAGKAVTDGAGTPTSGSRSSSMRASPHPPRPPGSRRCPRSARR